MAVSVTSATTVAQNSDGNQRETISSLVITGTYATGGFTLTAAQLAAMGLDGKVIWVDNAGENPEAVRWNAATNLVMLFGAGVAGTLGVEVTAATNVAGTYRLRVNSIGTAAAAPASN